MEPDQSRLPPDKRSWLERPRNKPADIGLIALIGGAALLVFMGYLALNPPVIDLGFGGLKDFPESAATAAPPAPTQIPVVTTPWTVKEITITPTITPITTSRIQELGPIVLHPGARVVAVTVDKRKYNQVFFYYTRNDNPNLEIRSFKIEMMNSAGQYSSQAVSHPQKWQDTYLDQIRPTTGKDLVVVTANFSGGIVQTVLMNYI
jgi:hypothetical protein